jgi:hypothetical protein
MNQECPGQAMWMLPNDPATNGDQSDQGPTYWSAVGDQ